VNVGVAVRVSVGVIVGVKDGVNVNVIVGVGVLVNVYVIVGVNVAEACNPFVELQDAIIRVKMINNIFR